MKKLYSGKLVLTMLMLAMSFAFVSCNKDDDKKVDCDAIENQVEDLSDDLEDAFNDGDCDEVEDILNELLDIYKKNKSCEFIIEEAEDAGYDEDEIDDYIEELEDSVEETIDFCNSFA